MFRRIRAVDSWVLPISVNGVKTNALIDSGASCCLLSRGVYEAMSKSNFSIRRGPHKIFGVGNNALDTLGEISAICQIAGSSYPIDMIVSSSYETIGCYLGMDFFLKHNCDFSVKTGQFTIEGKPITMRKEQRAGLVARVRIEKDIVVPARCETTICGRPEKLAKQMLGRHAVAEPSRQAINLSTQGLSIGAALAHTNNNSIPVPVVNVSDKEYLIRKGTTIAVLKAATHIHNWSDDEEELSATVRAVSAPHSEDWKNLKAGDDTAAKREPGLLDPSSLPKHLQPLLEGLASDVTVRQKHQLASVLDKYQDVFSNGPNDIGRTNLVNHEIDTGESRPIRVPARRLPISKQDIERTEVQKMVEKGVIQPSASPWASPIVLVTKKDGSTRFCVDYRQLNDVTRKDAYPLPRIDDTLDALSGSKFFSTLDLCSGYWQVEMSGRDKPKTAFATRQGLYEWNVMPFGLCNAPATFERLMELVLSGLTWTACLVYIDDVIVFGKTFEDALRHLTLVLERLRRAGLKLKPSKCFLFRDQTPFLGHIVTRQGITVDPRKTEAVQNWPIPNRVKDVRSFLGTAQYYRRFIPNFSSIAAPLVALTNKAAPTTVQWDASCQSAFDCLKAALAISPVLSYPDRQGRFIVSTDASNDGVGAVLEQIQTSEDGSEETKVIAYWSKALSRAQRKYCATHKELLAVVTALEQFRYYLSGRHFDVITDHASLTWLLNFKNPEGMIARWLSRLALFHYTITHKAGKLHGNADGLSRQRCRPCKRKDCPDCRPVRSFISDDPIPESDEEDEEDLDWHISSLFAINPTTSETNKASANTQIQAQQLPDGFDPLKDDWPLPPTNVLIEIQEKDKNIVAIKSLMAKHTIKPKYAQISAYHWEVKNLWNQWSRLTLKQGVLYRKPKSTQSEVPELQYVTPQKLRHSFFKILHHGRLSGHQGINKTLSALKARYYWPNMRKDVESWCAECHTCGECKPMQMRKKSKLQQSVTGAPFERMAIDLMGPFSTSPEGYTHIMVMQDYFTKWIVAEPLRGKTTQSVADVFFQRWIVQYGCPLKCHTDQGGEFTSQLFKEVCDRLRVDKTVTTAYRPQSDGMVERCNRSLQSMLKAYVNDNRDDWPDQLPAVVCAYRATAHESTGVSPYRMLYGREMTMPVDVQFPTENQDTPPQCPHEYVQWMTDSLTDAHSFARTRLSKAALRQKKSYQESTRSVQFERGNWVWRSYPQLKPGKLLKKNKGPWLVLTKIGEVNYRIQATPDSKPTVVHVDKLIRYHPAEDKPLIPWVTDLPYNNTGSQTEPVQIPIIQSNSAATTPRIDTGADSVTTEAPKTLPKRAVMNAPLKDPKKAVMKAPVTKAKGTNRKAPIAKRAVMKAPVGKAKGTVSADPTVIAPGTITKAPTVVARETNNKAPIAKRAVIDAPVALSGTPKQQESPAQMLPANQNPVAGVQPVAAPGDSSVPGTVIPPPAASLSAGNNMLPVSPQQGTLALPPPIGRPAKTKLGNHGHTAPGQPLGHTTIVPKPKTPIHTARAPLRPSRQSSRARRVPDKFTPSKPVPKKKFNTFF